MNTAIFKMSFQAPVHFGEGRLSNSRYTFDSQRLFSALFIEMLRSEKKEAQQLYEKCKGGRLLFSDAFPYVDQHFYLPRPLMDIKIEGGRDEIKALKNLPYIPAESFNLYLNGKMNPKTEIDRLSELGKYTVQQRVFVKPGEDNEPYIVGAYNFSRGSGLYVMVTSVDEADLDWFNDWLIILGSSGIGGKRTSGLGRFEIQRFGVEVLGDVAKRLGRTGDQHMTLGFSFPRDDELNILDGGDFITVKKGGFMASESVNPPQKKRPFYGIASGSVFPKVYEGDIFDVSPTPLHPVYLYAKPLWMEVSHASIL